MPQTQRLTSVPHAKKVIFVSRNPYYLRFARVGLTVRHLLPNVLSVQLALIAQKALPPLLSVVLDFMQGHKPQFVRSARPDIPALQILPLLLCVQQALIQHFSHPVVPSVMLEISV
jgi:hypothetical protein